MAEMDVVLVPADMTVVCVMACCMSDGEDVDRSELLRDESRLSQPAMPDVEEALDVCLCW